LKRVTILGAHSAVAQSLAELIRERELGIDLFTATTTEHIADGLDLIDEALIRSTDLFVVAMEGSLIDALLPSIAAPIVDLREGSEAPARFFGLDANARVEGRVRIPVGLGLPAAAVLSALSPFGPRRASIVAMESAASRDQAGMDELSSQVRALFNMKDADAPVFGKTLAFNVVPERTEPLERDLRSAIEQRLVPSMALAVQRVVVPTFSADTVAIEVEVDDEAPSVDTVREALARGPCLQVRQDMVASDALGRDDALVLLSAVTPHRIGVLAASDRLRRGSATTACLAVERWLG
jgi:aspartate-semialdehyde dehydrogenase